MTLSSRFVQLLAAGLAVALLWGYWPVLSAVADRWMTDPKYSHGYFVPLFALWLLGWRTYRSNHARGDAALPGSLLSPLWEAVLGLWELGGTLFPAQPVETAGAKGWQGRRWGLAVVAVGVALHMTGEFFFIDWLSEISFLIALAGLSLCVGGWQLIRLAWPSIAYLVFMLPLPYFVEVGLANQLQRVATVACTYLLQMLGLTASAQGNIIELNNGPIFVAEACSGLGMMVTFFALATAVAIVIKRPLLDKLVVFFSAVPVAMVANIVRIVATGILFETIGPQVGHVLYHDVTGLLVMMPVALALIWLELKCLSCLLVEVKEESPRVIGSALAAATAPAAIGYKKSNRVKV
jgi:exosortase